MDVTQLIETSLTIPVVKSSPSKKLVIISAGAMKQMQDGKTKIQMLVEIDGKQITWIPNKASMINIAEKFGKDTIAWMGKPISLEVGTINGKEAVIAKPVI